MNNSIDKTTSFADTATPSTNSSTDIEIEDWMLEIWDWMDNHNLSRQGSSMVPRDPQSLLQLERLELEFGISESYKVIDGKSVLCVSRESTKPLPAAIGHLKNLKYLRLVGFKELPNEIEQLDNLETLVILKCGFVEFPKILCELKNLKSLNILSKSLKRLPEEFGNLSSLTMIDMRGTQIEYLPESIGNLTNLQSLQLAANEKLKALPDSIGNLTNLKVLEIRASDLKTLPESIGNLTQLKLLGFYRNGLNDLPKSITNLKELKLLDVRENPLLSLSDTSRQFLVDLDDKVYTQKSQPSTSFPTHFIL